MAESQSLSGQTALDLPRLYLHPAHAEQAELAPFSEYDLQREFAIYAEQGIPEHYPEVNFQALPSVHVAEGTLSAHTTGGSCELLLLFREISLGSDPRTGLPMIALAGSALGSVWLVLVRSDQSGLLRMLTVLGSMGAIRRDFADLYTFDPESLGKGSNAAVYGIIERKHPGEVSKRIVGKVMLKDYSDSPSSVPKDVSQEVTMLTAVQGHPSIVNFYGLFNCWGIRSNLQTQPHWVMLLERCDGADLFDNVIKKPFCESRARDVMAGVLSALAHVHSCLIVHRDVKPENVLLLGNGKAKLADFGIACHLRDMQEMDRRCGSPGYAAPEILGGRPYGTKVDCFGSGSLLFFLLCTKIPFDGPTIASTFRRTERCIIDFSVSPYFQIVSNSCKDLLLMLLQQSPAQRVSAKDALRHAWFAEDLDPEIPHQDRVTEPPRLWLTDPETADGRAKRGGVPAPPLPPPGRGASKGRSGALHRMLRMGAGVEREVPAANPATPSTVKRSERIVSNLPQLVIAAFRSGSSFSSFSSNGRGSMDSMDNSLLDQRATDNLASMHRVAETGGTPDDQRAFDESERNSERSSVRGYISRGLRSLVRSKPSLPDSYRTDDESEGERASFERSSFARSSKDGTATPSTSASGVSSANASGKGASWASGSSSPLTPTSMPLAPPKPPPRRVVAPNASSSSYMQSTASAASAATAASASASSAVCAMLPATSTSEGPHPTTSSAFSPSKSSALGTVLEHRVNRDDRFLKDASPDELGPIAELTELDDNTYDISAFTYGHNQETTIGIDAERQAMAAQAEENRMLQAALTPQPPPAPPAPVVPPQPPPREPGEAAARRRPAGSVRPSSAN